VAEARFEAENGIGTKEECVAEGNRLSVSAITSEHWRIFAVAVASHGFEGFIVEDRSCSRPRGLAGRATCFPATTTPSVSLRS
jgi:hypothetical protein